MLVEKISSLVEQQFPAFYNEDGEQFVLFVKAYYEYLEQSGKLSDGIRSLKSYRDIDTTLDEYIKYFQNDLLPSIPSDILADKRLVAKYIKYFNQTRGTLLSYKLFFKAAYGEDVDVYFPAEQVLRVSGGDWRIDRYLVTRFDESNASLIGKTIVGIDSGAQALVEDVIRRVIRGRDIHQIILSNIKNTFVDGENIRLKSDTQGLGHTPTIEAGISSVTITNSGAEYLPGDIVSIVSKEFGEFAKVVVVSSKDLLGELSFFINSGGSGYRASDIQNGSVISFSGGDGSGASFEISSADLINSVPIYLNTNYLDGLTEYSSKAPLGMDRFYNVKLASPNYGFPETQFYSTDKHFHDNENAIINIANTSAIVVDDVIYGQTSNANGVITEVIGDTAGNIWLKLNGYRNFVETEHVIVGNSGANSVGTVTEFQANTIGYHVVSISNTRSIEEHSELNGSLSNAFGVVKRVLSNESGNTTVILTANTSANLSSDFTSGPVKTFIEGETLRIVGTSDLVGTVNSDSGNTEIESAYTLLKDSLNFSIVGVKSINSFTNPRGGRGYLEPPDIRVRDFSVSSLNIRDLILTLQSDDPLWGTANSNFVDLNVDDVIVQNSTGAEGYVKGSAIYGQPITVTQFSNGTFQTSVNVWQKATQTTENIHYKIGESQFFSRLGGHVQGYLEDNRAISNEGSAKIVSIIDKGILGNNSDIYANVGANGAIIQVRAIDSGFSYKNGEIITLGKTDRNNAYSAIGVVHLSGVANSQGYYATTQSHLDSLKGYIHDGYYYQEYSYSLKSSIHLDRYKEIVKSLCHPAGQIMFGEFLTQSEIPLDIQTETDNKIQKQGSGTVSIANGSFDLIGNNCLFTTEFNDGDLVVLQESENYYSLKINTITNDNLANTTIAWNRASVVDANTFYYSESI